MPHSWRYSRIPSQIGTTLGEYATATVFRSISPTCFCIVGFILDLASQPLCQGLITHITFRGQPASIYRFRLSPILDLQACMCLFDLGQAAVRPPVVKFDSG